MKKLFTKCIYIFSAILLLIGASLESRAQTVTEYFEGATFNTQTFTNTATGVVFDLTNQFFIQDVDTFGVDPNTPASSTGYSSFYIDDFTTQGHNQNNAIKTHNGGLFSVKSLYMYPSSIVDGQNPTTDGLITFIGKKGGIQQFSFTKAGIYSTVQVCLNNNNYSGFTYVDFSAGTDNSNTDIDELDVVTDNTYLYVAIDNFQFAPAPASSVASLSNLSLVTGFVKHPNFSTKVFNYASFVGAGIGKDAIIPTSTDPNATILVNGSPVTSGTQSQSLDLNFGPNIITIDVTAQNGSTRETYTDTLYRALSTNSNLLTLVTSRGALTPGFSNNTLNYTKLVGAAVSSITFTGTTVDRNATITVGGSTTASGSASVGQPLNFGDNVIDIVVTAQDGSSKTFVVTVTRGNSNNANLFTLKSSHGTLNPTSPPSNNYTQSVNNVITSITLTPTTVDPNATVTVGGNPTVSGAASVALPLNVGDNPIDVVVTAQDGTTHQTYTVTVTRGAAPLNGVYEPVAVANPANNSQFVGDQIKVHEGLTPNGDGVNDFLIIDGIANHPDNKLQILNRSGQLVFEAAGYDNSTKVFDGHSNKNGTMQLPGTYFYTIDYTVNGINKHKTGFIVLKY
jgi:gliding motility-associated-like protein